jgi:hypothetical protein
MGSDGTEVEAKLLGERQVLTVHRWYGQRRLLIADCRTVAELGEYVDLADLIEVITFPTRDSRRTATP